MSAALNLATVVSWRSILGPVSHVRLSEIGPGARSAARRLGMEIKDGVAYLTRRTPDLAEALLAEQGPWKPEPTPGATAILQAIDRWHQQQRLTQTVVHVSGYRGIVTGPPEGKNKVGLRHASTRTFLQTRQEFR